MYHFGNHLLRAIFWLFLSEILCLILAFSLAIFRSAAISRIFGLLFGITAHMLLIGNCGREIAGTDAKRYRTAQKPVSFCQPLLLSLFLMLPSCITYGILCLHADSILCLNIFPLLNAPFIQLYRLLIGNKEPFSAITQIRRIFMAFPPLLTALSFLIGYEMHYLAETAKIRTSRSRK